MAINDFTTVLGSAITDYSNITISANGGTGNSSIWTVGPSYNTIWNSDSNVTLNPSARINLTGDDADIVINGESLAKTIRTIEERLNILRPNPALEAEWDQLRELGEQYRRLEAELREKQQMWDTLKKMPPPEKP